MASDDMKKMLMLIESCSCESNNEGLEEQDMMPEGAAQSAEQLAHVSDEALDNAYHYGRSSPGNSFGWQANVKSAEFAKQAIDSGETDIEKISDAIHKGWNVTAKAFVSNPDQFGDTEKLRAAGKLEAKLAQREKLMNIEYAQLPEDEKEKDRVVARALLKAITGEESGQEASSPEGVEEDFDLDAFMESIREMTGGQLDEIGAATLHRYRDAASETGDYGTSKLDGNPRRKGIDLARKKLNQTPAHKKHYADYVASGGEEAPHHVPVKVLATRKEEVEQIDELSPKKYTDAGNARVAQARELDNIALRGTGHAPHRPGDKFDARDFPKDTPQGELAQRADTLLKHGKAKALDAEKKSHVSPATARTIGLEEVEDVSTTKMSTAQEMAEKLFAENPKMTSDDVLDKGYELVLSQDGKGRADRLFHFNADFAEELVDMYNQIKDEASKSTVESDDAEFQSFMETLKYVMKR